MRDGLALLTLAAANPTGLHWVFTGKSPVDLAILVQERQFQKIFQGTKKYIQNPLYNWREMVYTEIIRDNGPDLRAQQNKKHSGVIRA